MFLIRHSRMEVKMSNFSLRWAWKSTFEINNSKSASSIYACSQPWSRHTIPQLLLNPYSQSSKDRIVVKVVRSTYPEASSCALPAFWRVAAHSFRYKIWILPNAACHQISSIHNSILLASQTNNFFKAIVIKYCRLNAPPPRWIGEGAFLGMSRVNRLKRNNFSFCNFKGWLINSFQRGGP